MSVVMQSTFFSFDPRPLPGLSPSLAADVWEAARQAVPSRWLAPGKPLWTLGTRPPAAPPWQWQPLLDPPSFEALCTYEQLKREANIRVMAEFSMGCEREENQWLYGSDKSKWPPLMTDAEARAKAAEILDNYAPTETTRAR